MNFSGVGKSPPYHTSLCSTCQDNAKARVSCRSLELRPQLQLQHPTPNSNPQRNQVGLRIVTQSPRRDTCYPNSTKRLSSTTPPPPSWYDCLQIEMSTPGTNYLSLSDSSPRRRTLHTPSSRRLLPRHLGSTTHCARASARPPQHPSARHQESQSRCSRPTRSRPALFNGATHKTA
jgi:hypothetical protein